MNQSLPLAGILPLLEALPQGVLLADGEGRLFEVNSSACRILGKRRTEILASGFFDPRWLVLDQDGREVSAEAFLAVLALRSGTAMQQQILGLVKEAEGTQWLEISMGSLPGGAVVMSFEDITERKKKDDELKRARDLLAKTSDSLFIIDPPSRSFLDVNETTCLRLGYCREELLGMRIEGVDPVFPIEEWGAHIESVKASLEGLRLETCHQRKDGFRIPVEVCVRYVTLGTTDYMVASARDITERKQAEAALLESEERYRSLFESTQAVMLILDPETGRIVEANPAAAQFYGWTKEELLHKSLDEINLTPPPQVKVELERVRAGEHRHYEFKHRLADGSIRDVEAFTCPLSGVPVRLFSIIHDITDRKQAERQIRVSEEKFHNAFHTAPVVASLSRLEDGTILDVNDQYCQVLGFSREEILGRRSADVGVIRPEERAWLLDQLKRTGRAHNLDFTLYTKTGRPVPCLFSGEIFKVGEDSILLSMLVDMSERLAAEKSWKDALAFNQQIISSAREGVVVYGTDGRYTLWNPFMEDMTGVSAQEVLGKRPGEVFPFLEEAGVVSGIERALGGEVVLVPAFLWEVPERGCAGWAATSIGPLRGSSGEIIGVIEIVNDLSAAKQAEELHRKMQSEMQHAQKMESLGSLAGGVAHDINNVLGAILGLATLQEEQAAEGSGLKRSMETIAKACHRGATLVKGLLGFARQGLVEEKILDLNALVLEEVALLERTTLQKIRLEMDLAQDLQPIKGDPGALSHALLNLCVNAVDAMPEGGALTFTTCNGADGRVRLEVRDTGSGMSADILEKAMDPFFTTKPQGKGTGLGLSIVYGTLKAHGGTVDIQSESGRGTRVVMCFPPCALEGAEEAPSPEPVSVITPKAMHVLLVDDDELIQGSLPAMLQALGHAITQAASGEEALALLQAGLRPDAVILDLNMPGMGGGGLLPALRTHLPDVPILLATGRVDQMALGLVESDSRMSLLAKPFGLKELRNRLESL